MSDNDGKVMFVRIPADLYQRIASAAKADDSSIARFVRQILRREIERLDNK